MKTLFKKMLAGAILTGLLLNANFNAQGQAWNIPGVGAVSTGSTTGYIGTTGSTDNMIIKTNGAERMRISSAGLVGIGNFSSSSLFSPFQVGYDLNKFSIGTSLGRAYIGFNAAYDGSNWNIYTEDDDNDHGGAIITTEEDGSMIFYTKTVGGRNDNQPIPSTSFFTNSYGLKIWGSQGGIEMPSTLSVAGSISVGTISSHPAGYKLFVDDGIITEKIKVATQTWSDFVFDKSYKLMPLEQVEKFISKNKHLPDVPSEGEMIENGLDIATMDATLLQKIEELTLYIIEIKKENEALKTRMLNLENNQ